MGLMWHHPQNDAGGSELGGEHHCRNRHGQWATPMERTTPRCSMTRSGITVDSVGNLYVADYGNYNIRKIAPSGTNWVVSTIAGVAGKSDYADGTGTNAWFNEPWGATVDNAGNLFVTDIGSATIRLGLRPLPPVAGFGGTPTSGVVPLTVTFTNFSSNATNYVWNFGDGNMLSIGSNANVTDTYTNAGAYTVILTAHGPGGVSVLTNTAYIVVTSGRRWLALAAPRPAGRAPDGDLYEPVEQCHQLRLEFRRWQYIKHQFQHQRD